MSDHLIQLPAEFHVVQAREIGKSPARHLAASLAMLLQLAGPAQWKNPQELVGDIFEQLTGQPDIPTNQEGQTKEQVLGWLAKQNITVIDETARIADPATLRAEMQAQNLSGVVQLLILASEAPLRHAISGQPLHNWLEAAPGSACSLIRVGYSDNPYAFYLDASLSPAFAQPVPILWDDIEKAGILCSLAILGHSVEVPPSDFRYYGGLDEQGQIQVNPWPTPVPPKPEIDVEGVKTTLSSMETALSAANQAVQAANQALQAANLAHQNILETLENA